MLHQKRLGLEWLKVLLISEVIALKKRTPEGPKPFLKEWIANYWISGLWPLGRGHIYIGCCSDITMYAAAYCTSSTWMEEDTAFRLDSCYWWLKAWKDTKEESRLKFLLNRSHSLYCWRFQVSDIWIREVKPYVPSGFSSFIYTGRYSDFRGQWEHKGREDQSCWLYVLNACF